ncbi:phosphoinositide 3-kinase adapter protein 1 isoform X1 [Harmonia axyridis]|uniref:phosphoinositide 3-kinase adapter protein 1 isoform X1 n=2 Tax=Harmonia axyridis TaxID=115357 RepID=UPI001E277AC3|nr:phosphoinositide 3-kinase adapter protein 1 isoform X1 [Harmonia axyridis]XP_045478574.1 phosphoinositide 3-kinase adapter protein 1 isoform X1 [Harmonia axyridis]
MDLDNPSYFNVAGEQTPNGTCGSVSSSSECSLSRQLTPPRNRMGMRSFARSISSNSTESSQFIRGEPRLSDLAPDLAAKHISKQKTKVQGGIVYSSLALEPESDSGDEVFLDENTARYYNCSGGNRRHSVGSYAARDRTTSVSSSMRSFREEMPSSSKVDEVDCSVEISGMMATSPVDVIDDHSIRHGSYPRKRCNKCIKGTASKRANMDDILMVSLNCSQAATLWVEYFTSYFQQIGKQTNRKSFKIQHLNVEDFIEAKVDTNIVLEKSSCVKLQLVVMCPGLLDYISEHPDNAAFGKLFLPDRTLALLLGVTDDDLTEVHRKALPTYFKWQRMSVGQDQDENFTKEFIGHAMSILARVWKQQSSVAAQEKSCFSVSPKKIRQGQNSVFILLAYPLQKEDSIKISVEKNNEMIEVKNVKRRNPYTIKISVPDSFTEVTAIINIIVEKNGSIIGSRPIKCESRLKELEQILSNLPVEFMYQTLGFTPADRESLDNWLVHNFQKNLPPHFSLLASHSTPFAAAVQAHKHSCEEFPTLLHFSAKFGLEKLALQLLECPGADVACEIKNIYDFTPAEIAEHNNHSELAASLRNYLNMNEFSNMYAKLKAISSNHHDDHHSSVVEYLVPRNHEDLYKLCPAPRPVNLKLSSSPNSPSTSSTGDLMSSSGYTPMHTPSIKVQEHQSGEEGKTTTHTNTLPKTNSSKSKKHQSERDSPSITKQASLPNNFTIHEDKVQKELLEIINDFKNNVHSISQVEKLVDEWKNRNDVQKSFKEKQEQLKEMRLRYEKIQHEMKVALKKPSPFERIKKIFSRHKSREDHEQHVVSKPTITSSTSNLNISNGQSQRPVSSLSTSSSSSSGRMSTISGCSLGDSGTHSDNEDRKNMMRMNIEDDFRNELSRAVLNMHYTPLPAPKPVKCNHPHKTKLTTTIEETMSNQPKSERTSDDQYYIQFPPSGLPVTEVLNHAIKKIKEEKGPVTARNDYMNISANPCCSNDSSSSHEYMNFRTPTSIK